MKIEEHLRFHPLVQIHPDNHGNIQHDPWKYWKIQVQDMHQFCHLHNESWAWEYLWRNWYCPRQWIIWAWAAHEKYPVVNSNSMVESLWARLKRKYLKHQPKPSLEVLGDIIMNQFIHSRRQIVHGIRQGTTQPAWYTDFSAAWRVIYCRSAGSGRTRNLVYSPTKRVQNECRWLVVQMSRVCIQFLDRKFSNTKFP